MQMIARDCRKALYGILLGAILFLTLLPNFGWAWHRVLPEHSHVFLGTTRALGQDTLPETIQNDQQESSTLDPAFANTAIVHLPDPTLALQIFAIAIALIAPSIISVPTDFSFSLISPSLFYKSPTLPLLDPPPTAN